MTRALRQNLVQTALEWQRRHGVAPAVTSALAEFDAARLFGMLPRQFGRFMNTRSAVSRGHGFVFHDVRYQEKANRPSGRSGSKVTKIGLPSNFEWDVLIWILYGTQFKVVEAWKWARQDFVRECENIRHLRPQHLCDRAKGAVKLR